MFYEYVGLDSKIFMQAFGFNLDSMFDDFPEGDIEPAEEMIDEIYHG